MRSLFLTLFVLCLFGAPLPAQTATAPSAGTGTVGDPYQIATVENLYWITQNSSTWNSYFIQTANFDASATSGWSGGAGMPTIGIGSGQWFTGSYNGQGYTIYGLYINKSADYAGLFAYVHLGGIVKNVGLVNATISGQDYVGGITGANGGTISNCIVTGSVTGNQNDSWYVGGLVGENYTNIDSCYSSASVLGFKYIGGLAGASRNSDYHIANSYATGQVNSNANGYSHIGGLVGAVSTNGNIINCYATGFIYGYYDTGGLVGYTDGSAVVISNSFWDTQTTGRATSAGGTGKTTAEMKTGSTFTNAGWNFTAPWGMNASLNNGYPYLRALTTQPSIRSMTPSVNARNISASSNIVIVFSQPMNGASMVLNSTIRVDGAQSGRHSGSLSYNSGTYTATIDPLVNFIAGELVTVTVTPQVTSSGSFPIAASAWSFTIVTTPADTLAGKTDYATGTFPIDVIAADLDGDGDLDIAAPNQTVHTVSIFLNTGSGAFGTKTDYSTGFSPRTIAAGDLDRNGTMDLVTASAYSNTISVHMNNGSAVLAAALTYSAGASTDHVMIADLNCDGYPDIAATAYNENNVSVYINNGTGAFAARVTYASGANTVAIGSADVDGDNDLDLIIGNYEASTVSVLRNNGSGIFGSAEPYAVGANSIYLAMADLDADGDADIAVVNRSANSVTILKNNGTGTFGSSATYAAGVFPFAISAGDVDGDGDIDLAVSSQNTTTFSILKNNGTGDFSAKTEYAAAAGTLGICLADLNQDGDMDLITTNATANSISVFFNSVRPAVVSSSPSSNGTLSNAASNITVTFNTPMNAASFVSGTTLRVSGSQSGSHSGTVSYSAGTKTVTFDPTTNFAAGEQVSLRLTTGVQNENSLPLSAPKMWRFSVGVASSDTLELFVSHAMSTAPYEVKPADMDGDGDIDLVTAHNDISTVSILFNNGDGTYAARVDYAAGGTQSGLLLTDIDNDNDIDVIYSRYLQNVISVMKNNGNGTLAAKTDYTTGTSPIGIVAADIDADGDIDILAGNYTAASISVLKNNGDGTFAAKVDFANTNGAMFHLNSADMDGDGDVDLVIPNYSGGNVSIYVNNGQGSFTQAFQYTVGTNPRWVDLADVDSDGDVDISVAAAGDNAVQVFLNTGNGSMSASAGYAVGTGPSAVLFADLDGDGDADMGTSNLNSSTITTYKNNGSGVFSGRRDYSSGTYPYSLQSFDADGDGDVELVTANYGSNNISIVRNMTFTQLPVELISFTAAPKRGAVVLTWKTATEVNNLGFAIERKELDQRSIASLSQSTDGSMDQWKAVSFIEGHGTTNAPHEYSFIDMNRKAGNYTYRLKQTDRDGRFEYSPEVEVTVGSVPTVLTLEQNFPNPFNPSTTIQFVVPVTGKTTLTIVNAIGQEVAALFDGIAEAGQYHQATLIAAQLSSGIYFARLTSAGKTQVRKMMLVK